jgi:hypothetical protein
MSTLPVSTKTNTAVLKELISILVANGTITPEQHQAIAAVVTEHSQAVEEEHI